MPQGVDRYRVKPYTACSTGGTTGNTASQGNTEVDPITLDVDAVFFTALLKSSATLTIAIWSNVQTGTWKHTPSGGSGLYHGSVPFSGNVGPVTVAMTRNGSKVTSVTGDSITTTCTNSVVNWNAAVFHFGYPPIQGVLE